MIKVVVFGNQPIASWVVKKLLESKAYDVLFVVSEKQNRDFSHHRIGLPELYTYANKIGIPVYSDVENKLLSELAPSLAITVRWPKVIKKDTIDKFDLGVLNFHGGYLPRWRGLNIPTHVIMEGVSYSGATLHYLDEHVDTGPILAREKFHVTQNDTAYDVFIKTQNAMQNLFLDNIYKIKKGKTAAKNQVEYIDSGENPFTYKKNDPQGSREFFLSDGITLLSRAARAFEFPGYERAYIKNDSIKIYLTPEDTSKIRKKNELIDPFNNLRPV